MAVFLVGAEFSHFTTKKIDDMPSTYHAYRHFPGAGEPRLDMCPKLWCPHIEMCKSFPHCSPPPLRLLCPRCARLQLSLDTLKLEILQSNKNELDYKKIGTTAVLTSFVLSLATFTVALQALLILWAKQIVS